jgi:hypothetical protein
MLRQTDIITDITASPIGRTLILMKSNPNHEIWFNNFIWQLNNFRNKCEKKSIKGISVIGLGLEFISIKALSIWLAVISVIWFVGAWILGRQNKMWCRVHMIVMKLY